MTTFQRIEKDEDACSDIEVSLDFSVQSNERRNRVVSFARRVRVKKTLRKADYSKEECEATWYDEEELSEIRLTNLVTAGLFKNGTQFLNGDKACTQRGLERMVPNDDKHTNEPTSKDLQLVSTTAVLREQKIQKIQGSCDPERLAAVYSEVAMESLEKALARGMLDAKEAENISKETDEERVGEYHACASRASKLRARRGERIRTFALLRNPAA
jgi:hypothetical protein